MMILYFLYIAVIWVIILDLTDFMDNFKGFITALLTKGASRNSDYSLKPFDCSLCMTFWTCVFFMLITRTFTIPNIMIVLIFAWCTPVIKDMMTIVQDLLTRAIMKINEILK